MQVEPQQEHQWRQRLVGEWTYEHECAAGPEPSQEKHTGSENVRSLGGVWVLCEGRGEMPGGCAGLTVMWIYEGTLDRNTLTLDTVGPSFTPDGKLVEGKSAKYKDVIEFKSDDHRVLTSTILGEDGTWQKFMTAHYRRKK